MGLSGGTTLPSLTTLLAQWIPERERSKLAGFVMSGSTVRNLCFAIKANLFMNSIQIKFHADRQCDFIICDRYDSIPMAMADCFLFLEQYCCDLVYSICKFVKLMN